MYPENIEELLKRKYSEVQVDIDHDALWTRVYPQIKEDKKRPFVFWFVAAFLIGALVTSLFYIDFAKSEVLVSNDQNSIEVSDEEKNALKISEEIAQASLAETNSISSETPRSQQSNVVLSNDLKENNITPGVAQQREDQSNLTEVLFKNLPLETTAIGRKPSAPFEKEMVKRGVMNQLIPLKISRAKLDDLIRPLLTSFLIPNGVFVNEVSEIGNRFSFDFLAGYGKTSQKLNAIDPTNSSLVAYRGNNEEALDALSFSLLANMEYNKYLKFRSGLTYQMFTDRAENKFVKSELVDDNGGITQSFVDGKELLITTTTKTRYNSYHTVSIPLQLVAYSKMGPFEMELGAGIGLGYNVFNRGYIQYEEGEEYDLKLDQDDLFQSKLLRSFLMDLGGAYQINERIGWNTNVQYSYGLSGFNAGSNPISQKYNVIKINTGLRYQF